MYQLVLQYLHYRLLVVGISGILRRMRAAITVFVFLDIKGNRAKTMPCLGLRNFIQGDKIKQRPWCKWIKYLGAQRELVTSIPEK